jgi:hypothetical protein
MKRVNHNVNKINLKLKKSNPGKDNKMGSGKLIIIATKNNIDNAENIWGGSKGSNLQRKKTFIIRIFLRKYYL